MTDIKKNILPTYLTPAQVDIINQDVPQDLIKEIEGFSYVNHTYITNMLNKAFNYAWNWTIVNQGIEEAKPFKSKYNNNNNSSNAAQPKQYYCWVLGQLSVPVTINGETVWIHKQAYGGKTIVGPAKTQAESFKSASSSAFKKAASLLGIARNVYADPAVYEKMLNEEADADAWTEDNMQYYANECAQMRKFKAGISEEEYQKLVNTYCKETENYTVYGKITPSNISDFLDYVKAGQNIPPAEEKTQQKVFG